MAHTWDPSTGETKTGWSLGLTGNQPSLPSKLHDSKKATSQFRKEKRSGLGSWLNMSGQSKYKNVHRDTRVHFLLLFKSRFCNLCLWCQSRKGGNMNIPGPWWPASLANEQAPGWVSFYLRNMVESDWGSHHHMHTHPSHPPTHTHMRKKKEGILMTNTWGWYGPPQAPPIHTCMPHKHTLTHEDIHGQQNNQRWQPCLRKDLKSG